jgi:hypothetical protein
MTNENDGLILKLPYSLNCLVPSTIENPIRIGCNSDGGYIVPQTIVDMSDHLLSCGLGNNWSFESHWRKIKPNSTIHLYDGTVNHNSLIFYLRNQYQKFFSSEAVHFKSNIGPYYTALTMLTHYTTFSSAIERLDSGNIFLKMDIEGGEYALLDDIIYFKDRIPGIVIEFHFLTVHRERFISAIYKLKEFYEIVHTHGNNSSGFDYKECISDCFEFTFVRKDLITNTDKRWNFYLHGLDFSNHPTLEDYVFYGTDVSDD